MPKQGLLHDYDLMANAEPSAQGNTCVVCGASPMRFQWSDYSGEGMCTTCGCPYQIKWGSDEQKAEGKYPYLSLDEKFLPVIKEYWAATKKWTCFGMMLGPAPGIEDFECWLRNAHPELIAPAPAEKPEEER